MLRGYLSMEWTVAYSTLSGNDMKIDTTIGWSKQIVNCLWTYAFNIMWEHQYKLLADDEEGLKFTKVDNAIRNPYAERICSSTLTRVFLPYQQSPEYWQKLPAPNKRTLLACKPPKSDGKKAQTLPRLKMSSIPITKMPSKRKPRNVKNKKKLNARKTTKARKTNATTTTTKMHEQHDLTTTYSVTDVSSTLPTEIHNTTHHQKHQQHTTIILCGPVALDRISVYNQLSKRTTCVKTI
jgi:hypothetical protein